MKIENLVTRARAEMYRLVGEDLKAGELTIQAVAAKHGLAMVTVYEIAKKYGLRRVDLLGSSHAKRTAAVNA